MLKFVDPYKVDQTLQHLSLLSIRLVWQELSGSECFQLRFRCSECGGINGFKKEISL
jgi:hypothetical protein